MINRNNPKQISIEDFEWNFEQRLNPNNRWVRLANSIPWDEFRKIYHKTLTEDFGRPAKDARLVIGAMIIKGKKGLPDEEVIPDIQENPYYQYFVGLKAFTNKPIFDPSLFVTLRKRMGKDVFEKLNQAFIDKVTKIEKTEKKTKSSKRGNRKMDDDSDNSGSSFHRGQLIIDAVVAPQEIKHPTDLSLLNGAREHTERLIDQLWEPSPGKRKPRTYRENARRNYLRIAKKKRRPQNQLRAAIRSQLGYVRRNIKTIKELLASYAGGPLPFDKYDLKLFWVIQELYRQQRIMHDTDTNSISDRIVNLRQPHVRPIVRGKAGRDTEFGSKLSCSLVGEYVYLDHLDWNAFNESQDLLDQVENYRNRFGFYPESVLVDQIYGTRENRRKLKELGIRFCGKQLGRPPKLTRAQKRALNRELASRNRVEGKFGEGKRKYQLDCVKTRTRVTSESWIANVLFVMNLATWMRADTFLSIFKWVKEQTQRLFGIVKERQMVEIAILYG
jgi:IS5 family transposase